MSELSKIQAITIMLMMSSGRWKILHIPSVCVCEYVCECYGHALPDYSHDI